MQIRDQLQQYSSLMRLDKPIGVLLLLWPTLWALWLASHGRPQPKILFIFVAGVFLMRAAGCIVNDFADRHFDGHVKRTAGRPLASGKISAAKALLLAAVLGGTAFLLVLQCNRLTIALSFVGALLACCYPYLKRVTHLPQLGLGIAFSWGVPMAFAAETGQISFAAWMLFATGVIWPVIYDTMYAMVDRSDDVKIGIRSTAILFDDWDRLLIGLLQLLFLTMLVGVGILFKLHLIYYLALLIVSLFFIYQQILIYHRQPENCFRAFLNNNWVGLLIFVGIYLSYAV